MKTAPAIAAAILLARLVLASPMAQAQGMQSDLVANDPGFQDPALTAAAAVPAETVAPADVLRMMTDKRSNIALVDTQPASGFADAHLPGAINYPWVMQIKTFPIALPRNKPLIFYGSCPNDTTDIVRQLAEFGYFNVKIMEGGLERWMQLNYPTSGPAGNQQAPPELSQLTSKRAKKAAPSPH